MTPDRKRDIREWHTAATAVVHDVEPAVIDTGRDHCVLAIPELMAEVERLETRQQELLALTVRLTNEVPFPDEIKGWTDQRAKLVAEIGTLRSQLASAHRDLDEATYVIERLCDAAGQTIHGYREPLVQAVDLAVRFVSAGQPAPADVLRAVGQDDP